MDVNQWTQNMEQRLISWRREFHQTPEVGWTEFVTTAMIVQKLEGMGFRLYIGEDAIDANARRGLPDDDELHRAELRAKESDVPKALLEKLKGGKTGVVAILNTGRKGPHTALRFDIDALPILETMDENHIPHRDRFRSHYQGRMHACGHDGHISIGLGVASFLSQHQDELSGQFTLLFQPAEEGSRGAETMVEKGWLEGVDHFLSGHIGIHDSKIGQVAATTTDFLATTKWDVTFKGKAAHAGANPENGNNAMLTAANFTQNALAIPRHSQGVTRVNIGSMNAGSGRNVIPDTAYLQGETRGETNELDQYMFHQLKRVAEGAAQMNGVSAHIEVVGHGTTATCDDVWIERVHVASAESNYIETVVQRLAIGASEDATKLMNTVQDQGGDATYMIFGTSLPEGHHHPSFDFDEAVLAVGTAAFLHLIVQLHQ